MHLHAWESGGAGVQAPRAPVPLLAETPDFPEALLLPLPTWPWLWGLALHVFACLRNISKTRERWRERERKRSPKKTCTCTDLTTDMYTSMQHTNSVGTHCLLLQAYAVTPRSEHGSSLQAVASTPPSHRAKPS